jgi:hypothetical protein
MENVKNLMNEFRSLKTEYEINKFDKKIAKQLSGMTDIERSEFQNQFQKSTIETLAKARKTIDSVSTFIKMEHVVW